MARGFTRVTTIAAVVLLAGCGGGSGNKSAGTVSSSGAREVVSARQGAFRTVVPLGYSYSPSVTQYRVAGPQEGGIYDVVLVTREPVRLGDMNTLAGRTLRAARRLPKAHQVSQLGGLSVDGEPAVAVDYVVPAEGRETHVRQVFVNHGQWVYVITASSVTTQYATNSGALDEVTGYWRWQ